jgi:Tol biopolymer transport system component
MGSTRWVMACSFFLVLFAGDVGPSRSLTVRGTSTFPEGADIGPAKRGDTKGAGCTGEPLPQTQTDVSAVFSLASGVQVSQLTSSGSHNWNTYADLPTYSPLANVIAYNSGNYPAHVAIANLDGTDARVISGSRQGTQVQVTIDGKYAYFQGQNPDNTADIYAVALTRSGGCEQIRLTERKMRFVPPVGALVISNSSIDRATRKNLIAYSDGKILHRVLDDGTALEDLTLGDPENDNVFHRLRLNPAFPNILCYKRDAPMPNPNGAAQPEIWVVDLKSPSKAYSVTGKIPADHMAWSLDGTKLGYIYGGQWHVANVLNADGTFAQTNGGFELHLVGPSFSTGLSVNFCNLSPDGSVYVCVKGPSAIYLMSLDGTRVKPLANPGATGRIFNGIPKPQFLDLRHIIFASDRSGTVQLYVITGFTTTFP